ncbi:MAG: CPBP family intramembrane metalloprotease, partial [Ruminococcus sp.]|nr:CPBP family intramembrane metalloprotease [Ruminococcus sp.]
SGSIFTAMSVSVIYKMYELAITLLEVDPSEDMPLTRNFFILIVFITGAILMFIAWLIDKNGTDDESPAHGLAIFTSKQTFGMRVFNSVKIFPYSAVAAVCFVYAIIKLVY